MDKLEKKVNLDKIIQKMYDKFGDSLTEIEKARYLYLKLGELLRYDLNYQTDYKIKREDSYFKPIDFDNIKTNSYVCKQINEIYAELLRRAGIDAQAIRDLNAAKDAETPHIYTNINFKDGRKIIADLTFDLAFAQNGMYTEDFGLTSEGEHDFITDDELARIDRKIGYTVPISDKEDAYMDYFLELLKKEMEDEEKLKEYLKNACSKTESEQYNPENLIRYKFDVISRCFFLEKMGFVEGNRFLRCLYQYFFSDEEKEKIALRILHYERKSPIEIVATEAATCYCWKKTETDSEYYIYEQGETLKRISKQELEEKLHSKNYTGWNRKKIVSTENVDEFFKE